MTPLTVTRRLFRMCSAMPLAAGLTLGLLAAGCGSASSPLTPTPAPTATVASVLVSSVSTTGAAFQMTATALLTDGTSLDVTNVAVWVSSNTALASVSSTGVVRVTAAGEFDIRATYQAVVGSSHLRFFALPVVTVQVYGPTVPRAGAFQMAAVAVLSDGSLENVTDTAVWTSSNPAAATIAPGGFVTVVANGTADFTASYQSVTGTLRMPVQTAKTFALSGRVVDGNGAPLANVRVQLMGVAHAFTDSRGIYTIAGAPLGKFIVEYTKVGYQTWGAEITFNGDETQDATLFLIR